jgi:hypothetical protein
MQKRCQQMRGPAAKGDNYALPPRSEPTSTPACSAGDARASTSTTSARYGVPTARSSGSEFPNGLRLGTWRSGQRQHSLGLARSVGTSPYGKGARTRRRRRAVVDVAHQMPAPHGLMTGEFKALYEALSEGEEA